LDPGEHPEDPDYDNPQPWDNVDDCDYDDVSGEPYSSRMGLKKRAKHGYCYMPFIASPAPLTLIYFCFTLSL
jgi:hypothetical protein